jgi:hypothetical protein
VTVTVTVTANSKSVTVTVTVNSKSAGHRPGHSNSMKVVALEKYMAMGMA